MNWPTWLKVVNIGLISCLTFITPLASSMFAPGVPQVMQEFGNSDELLADFVVSVYVLGFALGPMVLAPMSELYGRLWIYHGSNAGFIVFSVLCAKSSSVGMLTACRFFQGVFGAAPISNGGGTIADVIPQEKRGAVLGIYALAPLLGPVIGPVAGGFLVAAEGWRWVFWVLTMVGGVLALLCATFLRETYAAVILERKAARLRKQTNNSGYRSQMDRNMNVKQLFLRAIVRPARILVFSPIVSALSLYMGVVYGYQYLLFSTFTKAFQTQYGFSTSIVGLTFLGLGVGNLIGLAVVSSLSDKILRDKSKVTETNPDGERKPEARLIPLEWSSLSLPAGLFLYGWTMQYQVHWIVPLIGTAIYGAGQLAVFLCIMSYLIDAFGIYAASALAANTIVRSIFGAVLPLAGARMYSVLGYGWGNSLLGFIALALVPIPILLNRYGETLRKQFDASRI
ncbi:putative MFS multidrug transporter [Pestalotiopsis sp. NC0098]|nr:putative MFS multidrug transporter [Pestalotiopsis sp. NC0098]